MSKKPSVSHVIPAHLKAAFKHGKKRGQKTGTRIRQIYTLKRIAIASGALALFIWAVTLVVFYWPQTVNLSYAGKTCVSAPAFLPSLNGLHQSKSYAPKVDGTAEIGATKLFASSVCMQMKQPPSETSTEKVSVSLPLLPFLKKSITVQSGHYPKLSQKQITDKPISTIDDLQVRMDKTDRVFSYAVSVNGKRAPCTVNKTTLSCRMSVLGLAQGALYDLTIERSLGSKATLPLTSQKVTTTAPIKIIGADFEAGQKVFNAPDKIRVQFNKLAQLPVTARLENRSATPVQTIAVETSVDGVYGTISVKGPLPRSANMMLIISSVRAVDGAYLDAPFELPFITSGGPKVTNVSIGSNRVQPNTTITLTFDSNIKAGQNLATFIQVEGAGATLSSQGNRVFIKTSGQGRCSPFTVRVRDGLKNEFDISGGSAWEFRSRTLCQAVSSIGSSVGGRGITAYSFGTGPNKIIFVGGTHGDEKSSVQILNKWIAQLEVNPNRIPAHQTIIIIPNLNPDGYAANRRTNNNGVDLNRNFPSNSWKSGVTMPDKSYWPTGGGTAPLSEPESQALANFVRAQQPRLILTYHAAGNIAQANGSGDSVSIASQYAQKSTVGYLGPTQTGSFFEYDTTGAFEDWVHDAYGWPAVLIELKSRTSNDYSGHQNALWYVAGL